MDVPRPGDNATIRRGRSSRQDSVRDQVSIVTYRRTQPLLIFFAIISIRAEVALKRKRRERRLTCDDLDPLAERTEEEGWCLKHLSTPSKLYQISWSKLQVLLRIIDTRYND